MVPPDWPEVRRIFEQGIATQNATFETAAPDWPEWDADHLPAFRLVARLGGKVVGWVALSPVSGRDVYRGVAEVSIYVDEHYRGREIGRALLNAVVEQSEAGGIWTIQGSVFPENAASLELLESVGFRAVGVRERIGQMGGRWRDTVLMERRSDVAGT